MKNAFEDAKTWIEHKVYDPEELAIRLHHRLVQIHPFNNGNGRLTRAFASFLSASLGGLFLPWSGLSLASTRNTDELRKLYLDALRAADNGDYKSLIEFGISQGDIGSDGDGDSDTATLFKQSQKKRAKPK